MFKTLLARARQGYRTGAYLKEDPVLPALFRGRPEIDPARCVAGCADCIAACPTGALTLGEAGPALDLGRCIFCDECSTACPTGAISFTRDWRLAGSHRDDLLVTDAARPQVEALGRELRRLVGRSLRLRQVSAGGCNGCEVEANALGNVVFDASRFGIEFVASPRHADGILVTGPVTGNMRAALLITYEAVADPRLVIAAGACAISGGLYRGHAEVADGVEGLLPVDLYIPGCPPHPVTVLDGLLRLLGRIGHQVRGR
ncbi:MAG TPA: NADH-quinone oxidoreductase subunit NuoB [Stellaceae bacterium]|nr:NADH-quinone oxidoreductase subunit NuoB [Stellaceae bacterium]